jgi:hypothetical protein
MKYPGDADGSSMPKIFPAEEVILSLVLITTVKKCSTKM